MPGPTQGAIPKERGGDERMGERRGKIEGKTTTKTKPVLNGVILPERIVVDAKFADAVPSFLKNTDRGM